jgi:hypothetical protein
VFKKHSAASFRARQSRSRYAQLHDPVQPFYDSIFKDAKIQKIHTSVAGSLHFSSSSITTHNSLPTTQHPQITTHKSLPTTHHLQPTKKAVNPAGSQSRFFTFPAKIFQNQAKKGAGNSFSGSKAA